MNEGLEKSPEDLDTGDQSNQEQESIEPNKSLSEILDLGNLSDNEIDRFSMLFARIWGSEETYKARPDMNVAIGDRIAEEDRREVESEIRIVLGEAVTKYSAQEILARHPRGDFDENQDPFPRVLFSIQHTNAFRLFLPYMHHPMARLLKTDKKIKDAVDRYKAREDAVTHVKENPEAAAEVARLGQGAYSEMFRFISETFPLYVPQLVTCISEAKKQIHPDSS